MWPSWVRGPSPPNFLQAHLNLTKVLSFNCDEHSPFFKKSTALTNTTLHTASVEINSDGNFEIAPELVLLKDIFRLYVLFSISDYVMLL